MRQWTTGRSPLPAAPSPIPVIASSEIGVNRTRLSPNLFSSAGARVVAIVITRSSRSISSISASSRAWANVISRTVATPLLYRRASASGAPAPRRPAARTALLGEHVDQEVAGVGIRARLGECHRGVEIALDRIADLLRLHGGGDAATGQVGLETRDPIAIAAAPGGQHVGPPHVGLRAVTPGVGEQAGRVAVGERGALAPARPLDRV